MPTITILGQGRMGAAMALRLRETGAAVTVWNRETSRCAPAGEAGATVADSAVTAVTGADVVAVMLADATAVTEVLTRVAAHVPAGAVVAQMSTIAPEQTRDLAAAFGSLRLVDAPVKGSVAQVRSGGLSVLAGGDAEDVAKARPLFEALGTVVDCGRLGDASAAKLVVNAAMISAVTALSEAVALAARLGVGEDTARELLSASPLGAALSAYDPQGGAFPVYLAAKDIRLARRAGDDLPVLGGVEARLAVVAETEPEAGLWTAVRRSFDTF